MSKARKEENGNVLIFCPGCENLHALNIIPENGRPCWTFEGGTENPTFSPSLLVRSGHYVPGQPPPDKCNMCIECAKDGVPTMCSVCHSFIKDGNIQFLTDSTHALAGQTVPLPDLDEIRKARENG